MPKSKPGRVYYYRMRTPEKRFEKNVRVAAWVAAAVAVLLGIAFAVATFLPSGEGARPAAAPTAGTRDDARPTAEAAMRDCAGCPAMLRIPAGSFAMGARPEEAPGGAAPAAASASAVPLHGVTLKAPFALQATEVTRGEFEAFVKATGHQADGCTVFDGRAWVFDRGRSWRDPGFFQDAAHPVVCVSAADARAYTAWLSGKAGVPYRLPSESEWEYAARAGAAGAFVWGNDATAACAHANVADAALMSAYKGRPTSLVFACDDGHAHTAPVGERAANRFGLADMFGNVREIVADCWHPSHAGAPRDGAARSAAQCQAAVSRGGGWYDPPDALRASRRLRTVIDERRSDQGFRVARGLEDGRR
jgi:formylglycine-generating enzyme required for sulfatase activity